MSIVHQMSDAMSFGVLGRFRNSGLTPSEVGISYPVSGSHRGVEDSSGIVSAHTGGVEDSSGIVSAHTGGVEDSSGIVSSWRDTNGHRWVSSVCI